MLFSLVKVGLLSLAVFAGSSAYAKTCKIEIGSTDQMQFDKKELSVEKDCKEVELTLKHTGKLPAQVMGHNWVLTEEKDSEALAADAAKAGPGQDDFLKGDKRVLAFTKLIGGGETTVMKFSTAKLKSGQSYDYICSFPGHAALMKGKLTFK